MSSFPRFKHSFVPKCLPRDPAIYSPAFFWIFMPKCQDVGCPSTPITDHDWYRRGVSKVFQNNWDHIGSSFHDESHHWNPLTDSCIKKRKRKGKKREKNTKPANQINKKRKKKHKLKLLSTGEVVRYEGIKYWVTFVDNTLVESLPPESPCDLAWSPQLTKGTVYPTLHLGT